MLKQIINKIFKILRDMADTRVKDAPDANTDLTGYYFCVDKDGQPSFEKVSFANLFLDSGFLAFDNYDANASVVYEQVRQVGKEVHGAIRVTVSSDIATGTLCDLPTGIGVPSEDIRFYATAFDGSAPKACFIDVSTSQVRFDSSVNSGTWYINFDYSV